MMVEVLRYIETAEPSLVYAWASLFVTIIASGALCVALAYVLRYIAYSHWLDVLVVIGALVACLTYATYYALLLGGVVTTAASPVLLRPVNVLLFAGLVLLARLVVVNNKIAREKEEIASVLLFITENWPTENFPDERMDDIQLTAYSVSSD